MNSVSIVAMDDMAIKLETIDDVKAFITKASDEIFSGNVRDVEPWFDDNAVVTVVDAESGTMVASFDEFIAFVESFGPTQHEPRRVWRDVGLDDGLAWARFEGPLPAAPWGHVLCVLAQTSDGWRVTSLTAVRKHDPPLAPVKDDEKA